MGLRRVFAFAVLTFDSTFFGTPPYGFCVMRVASGHAAAVPPSSVMNSRRCSGRDVRFIARPPPRSVRAAFPHTAPTSGTDGSRLPYASQHPVARLSGTEPGTCLVDSHSPRSPPFAPPTPQRIAPLCSSASQLLWHGQTSRARASSATAPRLPDADRPSHTTLTAGHETSQLPMRSLCT